MIPVLKEILAIDPHIKILGSPWSAPAWMKTNDMVKGGNLKPEFYGAYAEYLVKYIEGMKAEGIPITAITVENEPLNPKNTPSMVVFAQDYLHRVGAVDREAPARARDNDQVRALIVVVLQTHSAIATAVVHRRGRERHGHTVAPAAIGHQVVNTRW